MSAESTTERPAAPGPRTPPLVAGSVPVLGHAPSLVRDPLAFLTGLRDHGDLVRVKLGPKTAYAVCAPELVGALLRNSQEFQVGGPLWENLEVLLGKGVATSNGADHRRQRRMMQPAFRPERIASYATVMEEEARAMADRWQDGQVVDIGAETFSCAVRVVARSLLEVDSIGAKADRISASLHTVFSGLYRRMILSFGPLHRLPTPANRRFERALADLHHLVDEVIAERHAQGKGADDLLDILLTSEDGEGRPLGDQEIHDHLVSLIVAGAENVASTLAWCFQLLTEHPAEEQRVAEEALSVAPDRPVNFGDLGSLDHTRNVIVESMRIRPAAWIFTRRAVADTELGGYRIPAGADIIYSAYAMQHDPRSFDQPDVFDPDRWIPERAEKVPQYAMMPFSTGNRKCPGDHFSMVEATLMLATVLPRWRLVPVPETDPAPRIGITLQPKRAVFRVESR
ncbi:cytochrome P450 [Streptomyces sp. CAI-21]|uniref:bifunctional albaflavenone monooxygenase/terpene synthase n=1 Tax=Streptomyces sp. CAI-21 TaxID=1169743 RepID=UPI001587ED6D|nr:cytochrome P450 [Streptomyces sp. CAI-21]